MIFAVLFCILFTFSSFFYLSKITTLCTLTIYFLKTICIHATTIVHKTFICVGEISLCSFFVVSDVNWCKLSYMYLKFAHNIMFVIYRPILYLNKPFQIIIYVKFCFYFFWVLISCHYLFDCFSHSSKLNISSTVINCL